MQGYGGNPGVRPHGATHNGPMNYLVIVAFAAILGSLVAALVFMLRGSSGGGSDEASDDSAGQATRRRRMARALAFRVGFSILLFVLVLLAYRLGWIHPTGLPVNAG